MNYREICRNKDLVDNNFWRDFYKAIKSCQMWVRILNNGRNENKRDELRERIRDQSKTIKCFIECCQ